jgi:hypothetical protein
VADQIQFSSDGSIHSMDGQVLNRGVQNPSALSDAAKSRVGIAVNTPQFARFNTGSDAPATQGSSTLRVQLHQPTNLVKVAGHEVTPEVAETLTKAAPEVFVEPAAQQAQAKAEADTAAAEGATRESLNRHADDNLEAYHQHVVGEVNPQHLIGLLVYGQKGEAPPTSLLENIARDMGEPLDSAVTKVNAVAAGVHRQFSNLATAMGLDPEKASVWLKEHRKDTSMAATQAHLMRRDVMAWRPLLDAYKAATGDGRSRS